jgi:hypothetical protein
MDNMTFLAKQLETFDSQPSRAQTPVEKYLMAAHDAHIRHYETQSGKGGDKIGIIRQRHALASRDHAKASKLASAAGLSSEISKYHDLHAGYHQLNSKDHSNAESNKMNAAMNKFYTKFGLSYGYHG